MKHIVCFLMLLSAEGYSQNINPNLADPGSGCSIDSASSNVDLAYKLITGNMEEGWNTAGETSGAWVKIRFDRATTVREIWILARPIFSHVITPYNLQFRYTYAPARNITVTFSDGTTEQMTLSQSDNFQILSLPGQKQTRFLKMDIKDVWQGIGSGGTGLGKIRVFSAPNAVTISVRSMENYNGIENKPVKLAYLNIVNPGEELRDVHVTFSYNNAQVDDVAVGKVDGRAVSERPIWTFVPERDGEFEIELVADGKPVAVQHKLRMTAYRKTYFEGGKFLIHSTNHNDLGWLGTQFETADYRSREIILPALKIMETDPGYCYTMEAVAYLREFLARHPERKEEVFRLTQQGRFSWGASYTLMLQSQVGLEKLARQFYFGRRWLKENIPGADSRVFINADVPMLTWQLPQILKSAGVEYLVQARIPLGFYYWQGLDGTTIPMYGLRYGASPKISPKANEEWLNLVYSREEYYKKHNLPRVMIYDYNEDYLPPNSEYIPFVKEQNAMMRSFADAWNKQHGADKEHQAQPPVLTFVNPEHMLAEIFNTPGIHLETLRGEWPNSWAYYDEPGNREALLNGRKGHNTLLAAEKLFSFLEMTDSTVIYPKARFDTAWEATCWPDHGWGGGKGLTTDSIYHASYKKSAEGAQSLMKDALRILDEHVGRRDDTSISIVVYNALNWDRSELLQSEFTLPKEWNGFVLKDRNGTAVPFEINASSSGKTAILFPAEVPASGVATYRIGQSNVNNSLTKTLSGDSIETPEFKIVFGNAGITQYFDKIKNRRYFRTDKFQAGELLQFSAPGNAWEDEELLNATMTDFDRSGHHESRITRFVETPVRYIRETETPLKNCVLRQRFVVPKGRRDIELEVELVGWKGEKNKELRIAFPMNIEQTRVGALSTVPASCLRTPDGKSNGLLGEYFNNPDLKGKPALTRVDQDMAPYWDKSSPGEGVPQDFFSVRWTGTISVPETGDYILGIITDDKGRLFFQDSLMVDNWNPYEVNVMKTFRTRMEKGKEYNVRIEYADIVLYAGMRFQWRKEESGTIVKNDASISYEIPFGAVDYHRDEADFSRLPDNTESQFNPLMYGGFDKLPFREAVNWVNVSTGTYKGYGCLFASDMTVHLFEDQTSDPVIYPVVQHVLLSTRKSLAWDPEYWFDQKGSHTFRMALLFHDGNWRLRYRDGIAFNYPLISFASTTSTRSTKRGVPQANGSFIHTDPSNIVITTIKQSEDGKGTIIRFYEAEGDKCTARLKFTKPIREAFRADLLEYETAKLLVEADGSLAIPVKPWEIVTILVRK